MRFLKGQVEFVAIAAVILVVLIVVILAVQQTSVTPPVGTGISEEAKTVKDSVNNLIKTGLKERMKLIYEQGGTLNPQGLTVKFGMFEVPVWQACDQVNIPDVESEIKDGVASYLRTNLKNEEEFAKKKVNFDFSKMDVDVDIFKDSMRVRVNLPTTITDYSIPQPYEVTIPTKLYDILDFSKNFVNDNTEGRIFETALLKCILKSPTDPDSPDWIHPFGIQTGCGNMFMKKRSDLLPAMKKFITLTVSQVLWNERPLRSVNNNCFSPINTVGGKMYPDLNVYFEYPREWDSELNQKFFFSPNPLIVNPTPVLPFVPICMQSYAVGYTVSYPVVIQVEDPLTNQPFKFAVMADITNSMTGNCSAFEIETGESDYMDLCVNNAKCSAKITVKDTDGNPVEGADVMFDVCDIGRTDMNGVAEGAIPCGLAEFHVYKDGYKSYGDFLPAKHLEDYTVELMKVQDNITLHFNGLPLKCEGASGFGTDQLDCSNYVVEGSVQPILSLGGLTVFSTFVPKNKSIWVPEDMDLVFDNTFNATLSDRVFIEGLYPNKFDVSAFVTKNFEIMNGFMESNFTLTGEDKDIYIYMPVVLKMDVGGSEVDLNESIRQEESEQLTTVLKNCGIDPVGTTPQTSSC